MGSQPNAMVPIANFGNALYNFDIDNLFDNS